MPFISPAGSTHSTTCAIAMSQHDQSPGQGDVLLHVTKQLFDWKLSQ